MSSITNQAVQSEVNQRITLDELSQTMEYRQLSPKMAVWVSSYVQNFLDNGTLDPLLATRTAYGCRTEENARTFGYQLLSNPKIIFALNRFFGSSPEQSFLKAVEKAIYNRRLTVAQIQALKLYYDAQVAQGWSNGIPRTGTVAEGHFVGEVVIQDGNRFTVTAVDKSGKILEADEI